MSMEKDKIAYEQLLQGVQSYVNKCLEESNRDITTTGKIVEVVEDGGYTVEINGVQYSDIDTIGGECALNEMVRVVIPQGQYNNMFILKGGSDSGGSVTPTPSVSGVSSVNGKTGDVTLNYADVGALSATTKIPTKTSDLNNDSNYVSDSNYNHTDNNYTTADKNSVATIGNKVDKVTGKGLSTNDLTNSLKSDYDDAVLKSHEHINKSILDATTASYTTEDKEKLDNTASNTEYNTLKGRVDTNEDNIAMLDSDIEGLTTDVGTLKTDMTTVKGVVTTIQGNLNDRNLKTYITLSQVNLTVNTFTSFKQLPANSLCVLPFNNAEGKTLYKNGILPVEGGGLLIVCTTWKGYAQFVTGGASLSDMYVKSCSNFENNEWTTYWVRISNQLQWN